MNRDDLIYKWLNHELNAQELEAFKQLEDYGALSKLDLGLKHFKAPNYSQADELRLVSERIQQKKSDRKNWLPIALRIAAILVVCLGIYFYTTTTDTNFKTLAAQKQTIELPDASTVHLNALSELSFNTHQWNDDREVRLTGEAYFKVAKGSKFEVKTDAGTITVLGTEFNIKQRDTYFEVVCYEGLVNVTYNAYNINLSAGNQFLIRDGKLIATEKETLKAPTWIDNYSRFKSVPYREVLAEFERQYDVKINLEAVDDLQLFTGSFTHGNMEVALKSITLPLTLTYSKTNHTITLKRE